MPATRIVLFKWTPELSERRDEFAGKDREALAETETRVMTPADGPSTDAWDSCWELRADSLMALERVMGSPIYVDALAAATDRALVVKAWSFEG